MTLRMIGLFLKVEDCVEIESFRKAYDPLFGKTSPHITLVFPFESEIGTEELIAHVKAVCDGAKSFNITLGQAVIHEDSDIWLPVEQGLDKIEDLHSKLYSGILSPYLNPKYPYRPHVTIGRLERVNPAELLQAAPTAEKNYRISAISIEDIDSHENGKIVASLNLIK